MKKVVLILSVILAAASCRDNSYRGEEVDWGEFYYDEPVRVAVGDPHVKGSGTVDRLQDFAGKLIYVWAFNMDPETDFTIEDDNLSCLIDCAPALLDGNVSDAVWADKDPDGHSRRFYYPGMENANLRYNFYAAYLDLPAEATAIPRPKTVSKTPDSIVVSQDIDGSQDLMFSQADVPTDYAFSYISAAKGIYPVFTMNHALVGLDLYIKQGITPYANTTVTVEGARIESLYRADITVAAKDPAQMAATFRPGATRWMNLLEADGTPVIPYTFDIIEGDPADPEKIALQTSKRLGGSFFLAPQLEYSLRVLMGGDEQVDNIIRLPSGASFEAGNKYKVTMTVYGKREAVIEVEPVPWEYAGSFTHDPDEKEID